MAPVSKPRRPYVRSRRTDGAHEGAGRLSSVAGMAARPTVEALEPRKLLFSLVIDEDNAGLTTFQDLGGGLARATAAFAYFIPYLNTTEEEGDSDFDDVDEDFDSVEVPATVGGNGLLLDSGVLVATEGAGVNATFAEQGMDTGDNALFATFTNNVDYLSFTVQEDDGMGNLSQFVNNLMRITVEGSNGSITATAFLRGRPVSGPNSVVTLVGTGNIEIGADEDTAIVFDEVRFTSSTATAGVPVSVALDATPDPMAMGGDAFVSMFQQPPGNSVDLIESRTRGAFVSITGTIGSSATFFDLYGRQFISTVNSSLDGDPLDDQSVTSDQIGVYESPTLSLGTFGAGNVALGDLDDDGIPGLMSDPTAASNDGIGRVELAGFDSELLADPSQANQFSFYLAGGRIESFDPTMAPPDGAFRVSNDGFAFFLPEGFTGDSDNLEDNGLGIFSFVDDGGDFVATGLGDGVGSVTIGSPFIRAVDSVTGGFANVFNTMNGQTDFLNNYNPYGVADGLVNTFTADNQGIKYLGTSTITETFDGLTEGTLLQNSVDATGAIIPGGMGATPVLTFFGTQTIVAFNGGNGGTGTQRNIGGIGSIDVVLNAGGAGDDFISFIRLDNADQMAIDDDFNLGALTYQNRLLSSQVTFQASSFAGSVNVQLYRDGVLLDEYVGVNSGGILTVRDLAGGNTTGIEPGSLVFDEVRVTAGGSAASFTAAGLIWGVEQSSIFGESYVDGMVFGVSEFQSALNRYYAATQGGSIIVDGDLGSVYVAGDAGVFFFDPDDLADAGLSVIGLPSIDANAQLIVGRTLGSFSTGGRNLLEITVDGRVSSPSLNSPNDVLTHHEHETLYEQDNDQDFDEADLIRAIANDAQRGLTSFDTSEEYRGVFFGTSLLRNDSLLSAEFVGGAASAVVINGSLGGEDVSSTAFDFTDVYAFAAGGDEVQFEFTNTGNLTFRVMDYRGRTVAAAEQNGVAERSGETLTFTPNTPGVYYLAVQTGNGNGDAAIDTNYSILINNIAPTTIGSYRTGLGWASGNDSRDVDDNMEFVRASVTVADGSLGLIRSGTGYIDGSGSQTTFSTNTSGVGGILTTSGLAVNVDQDLFGFFAGDDVNAVVTANFDSPVDLVVGGNLGIFATGLIANADPNAGQVTSEGDVSNTTLDIGGSIGLIDIAGAINLDQDTGLDPRVDAGGFDEGVVFRTGMNGGVGDIGSILVGSHVFFVEPTPGFDQTSGFLIDTSMAQEARIGYFFANYGENAGLPFVDGIASNLFTEVGVGSDIRFLDTNGINIDDANDASQPIGPGLAFNGVDDGGGRFTVSLSGDMTSGRVIQVPVEGSAGVAIARIEVDLSEGGVLTITSSADSVEDDVISIGRIVVTGADANSRIIIQGTAEIDVHFIEQTGGDGFLDIRNFTRDGDIVAIDVVGLDQLEIFNGNLGRTELPAWGPKIIGPFLGTNGATSNAVGEPLNVFNGAINGAAITDGNYNNLQFRPLGDNAFIAGNAYADDVGFPIDGFLDGIVVRTGSIQNVLVGKAVGDVITQEAISEIGFVQANARGTTPEGEFYGIVGNIFSFNNIQDIDVGDGLVRRGTNPLIDAGIFAQGNIGTVRADRMQGAFIHGVIFAGGGTSVGNEVNGNFGIADVIVNSNGGDIRNAVISTGNFDGFWMGRLEANESFDGTIQRVTVIGGDLQYSRIESFNLDTVSVTGGVWDANVLSLRGNLIGVVQADEFLNSTIDTREADEGFVGFDAQPREFRQNSILVAENATSIRTNNSAGDMSDLLISVAGSITGGLFADTMTRLSVNVPGTIAQVVVTSDLLATDITAGQLNLVSVARGVSSSEIEISGPLINFTATEFIRNTSILVSGPDGRIDNIFAGVEMLDVLITSSGPVGLIRTAEGDIRGEIRTTTSRGTVGTIEAGGDLEIDTDFSRTVANLIAGGNIGSVGTDDVIIVRGSLTNMTVNGQIYSEVRVTRNITGVITINDAGTVFSDSEISRALITAFGFINSVQVTGDFAGTVRSDSSGIRQMTITDGSLTVSARVIANDGSIDSLVIDNGNLLGDVFAELDILSLEVNGEDNGTGDIGRNPNSGLTGDSAPTAAIDGPKIFAGRNIGELLVTNGSIFESFIYARRTITNLEVSQDIRRDNLTFASNETLERSPNIIAAGARIENVTVGRNVFDTLIIAGITSFGEDSVFNFLSDSFDRAGGFTLETFDVIEQGQIDSITIGGNARRVKITAGVNAGVDGVYNTADDTLALGFSQIGDVSVAGSVNSLSIFTDRRRTDATVGGIATAQEFIGGGPGVTNGSVAAVNAAANSVAGNNIRFGGDLPSADMRLLEVDPSTIGGATQIMAGTPTEFMDIDGRSFRVTFTNPGGVSGASEVWWDAAGNRVLLFNTRSDQSVLIERLDGPGGEPTDTGILRNFGVVSNDDSFLDTLEITGALTGTSLILVDAYIDNLVLGDLRDATEVTVGSDVIELTVGSVTPNLFTDQFPTISARFSRTVIIGGSFGLPDTNTAPTRTTLATLDLLAAGTLRIDGNFSGLINVERSVDGAFTVTGDMERALFRVGKSVGAFTAMSVSESRFSAGDNITSINVTGDVFDTSFQAGGDLGSNVNNGTNVSPDTRGNTDRATTGVIGGVFIGGDFLESDLVAGYLRGEDGFFGTTDDILGGGVSTVGQVTIAGNQIGSDLDSESFTIASVGNLGFVGIGGVAGESTGNFSVGPFSGISTSLEVVDVRVDLREANIYAIDIVFNQAVDASTLASSIRVFDERFAGTGDDIEVLFQTDPSGFGNTFSIEYDPATFVASVVFNTAITTRDIAASVTNAAPGLYRFEVDSDVIRGSIASVQLEEDATAWDFVGDVGDRVVPTSVTMPRNIDFYGAAHFDALIDIFVNGGSFTIEGQVGDHPDESPLNFDSGADIDAYSIELQAGDIFTIGQLSGNANEAAVTIIPDPVSVAGGAFTLANPIQLVGTGQLDDALSNVQPETQYLVLESGRFEILVGTNAGDGQIASYDNQMGTTVEVNTDPSPREIGEYRFDISIIRDLDSGFNGPTDASDGTQLLELADFTGAASISTQSVMGTTSSFVYERVEGQDTADAFDDVYRGRFLQRLEGDDGMLFTADDEFGDEREGQTEIFASVVTRTDINGTQFRDVAHTVNSAVGERGQRGSVQELFFDVDVFHLNNSQTIIAGSEVTVIFKQSEVGTNLNSLIASSRFRFGLFDTSASVAVDDARLVFAPTDLVGRSLASDDIIAESDLATYGYDANGDFFITFLVPPSQDDSTGNTDGSFAFYIQGPVRADYTLDIVQSLPADRDNDTIVGVDDRLNFITDGARSQRVLIEAEGGRVDWLQVAGIENEFGAFDAASLGFVGPLGDGVRDVNDFIRDELVMRLDEVFSAPTGGSGNGYNIIFSTDPNAPGFEFSDFSTVFLTSTPNVFGYNTLGFGGGIFAGTGLQPKAFGYAEHSDPFNADQNDEAVVFAPSFVSDIGAPTGEELDDFIDDLTNVVSRRVAELLGLRFADSTLDLPLIDADLPIFGGSADQFIPDFTLGVQNPERLLDLILEQN